MCYVAIPFFGWILFSVLCLAAELSMVTLFNVLYGNVQGGVHIRQNVFNVFAMLYDDAV